MIVTSCEFNAKLIGTGDFVVASATAGHQTPEQSNVTDGKIYTYYAQSFDTAVPPNVVAWEAGSGIYTISTHILSRTTITANSNGDTSLVDFTTPPVVDVYASPAGLLEPGPAWTSWSPIVTPQTGAFATISTNGGYSAIGKSVSFSVTITITAIGTASGNMTFPLPLGTAKRAISLTVTETAVVGFMGYGRIAANGTIVNAILKYDNTSYIGNGYVITISGTYERL